MSMFAHTGNKPYKCDVCQKRYAEHVSIKDTYAYTSPANNAHCIMCHVCHM